MSTKNCILINFKENDLNSEIKMPRLTKRRTFKQNTPSNTA